MHPGKSIRVPYRTLLNQPHERIRQHLHAGRRYERADHAIKDTIDIAAYRTTAASGALANAPPAQRHATVVERVLAAGWCIVGKTNMHELAFGMTGINAFTGTPQKSPGCDAHSGRFIEWIGGGRGSPSRRCRARHGHWRLRQGAGRLLRRDWVQANFRPRLASPFAPVETMLDCVGPFARDMRVLIDAMAAIAPDFDRTAACESTASYTVGIVSVDTLASISAAVARAPAVAGLARTESS
jgi:amidase